MVVHGTVLLEFIITKEGSESKQLIEKRANSRGRIHVVGMNEYSSGNNFFRRFMFRARLSFRVISFIPGKWFTFYRRRIDDVRRQILKVDQPRGETKHFENE
jgi:hypothetical protein